jgi:hypothetical protein
MDPREQRRERVRSVARELGISIRKQVRARWDGMLTAERTHRGRHVWRFRSAPGENERFLHIEHRAMANGSDPADRLLKLLDAQRWMELLEEGPHTALLLSARDGLAPLPQA